MPSKRRVLSEADARRIVAERCLPQSGPFLVGLELEFLTFVAGDPGRPAMATLEALARPPLPGGSRVTFEPGGQVELSTPPHSTAVAAIAATTADVDELETRAARAGIELVAIGTDRWRPPARVVDNSRYRAMEAHFDSIGPAGRRMMCNTAALQINVGGIDDAGWRVANLIGPPLIASFANSPGDAGCPSTRMTTWQATEPCRTDPVGLDRPLAAAWSDYALHACALMTAAGDGEFVRRPAATSFAHWLANGDSAGFPTAEDLDYHLTTLFPPVRPRGWFELRYFDALPSPYWEVATRVVAALLNPAVRDEVTRAMPARPSWVRAASVGLRDTTLGRAADACFALAIGATADDSIIEYNDRYVARRRCPADDAGVAPRESVWA